MLSRRVKSLITLCFTEPDRAAALECLTMLDQDLTTTRESDRVLIAALKCSRGSVEWSLDAAALALVDFRDVLVNAEFGDDIHAHETWTPDW